MVWLDETNKQLIEACEPLPTQTGQVRKIEHEYVRNGAAQIFLDVAQLWTGDILK